MEKLFHGVSALLLPNGESDREFEASRTAFVFGGGHMDVIVGNESAFIVANN